MTLVEGRRRTVRSTAATGPVPEKLDGLQESYQQGPCLESVWEHHTVIVDDFLSEVRWPEFVAAAISFRAGQQLHRL